MSGADETVVRVAAPAPYDVVVGRGVLDRLAPMLGEEPRSVAVVHSPAVEPTARRVRRLLSDAGHRVSDVVVPDGEAAKTPEVAARCWAELGRLGLTRSDAVVAVGGGATTDVAGFAAATYLRGISVAHVPTSLLGMVDAAIGGKTGVDTEEGKNLVGAFHDPLGVVCDLDLLATLPAAELVSGLAEVVKCGFIADPEILGRVQEDPAAARDPGSDLLLDVAARAIAVKAAVVADDPNETTSHGSQVGREGLNYGHTLGHAIERRESYRRRHGEAVAIGMVYAAELARIATGLPDDVVALHRDVLRSVGLPAAYPGGHWTALLAAMQLDKKARGDRLRLVVLEDVGRTAILAGPEPAALEAAYERIRADRQ